MKKYILKYIGIISILIIVSSGVFSNQLKNILIDEVSVFNENYVNKLDKGEKDRFIVGNYYLTENNWLLGKFSKIIPDNKMKVYANEINDLSKLATSQGKDTYFVSMTHKTNMLKHLYPSFVENKNNIDLNKDSLASKLDKNYISFIDIDRYFLSNFSEKERENFYFKTDHHWNGIGAFEGFEFIINNMDLDLSSNEVSEYMSKYKVKVIKDKEFIGSYNRKLNFIVKDKEFANYVYKKGSKLEYFITDGSKEHKLDEEKIMATLRNKNSWDYGGAYMRGTNCNILKIKNRNSLTDKKVLIFRDSYQAPMTWLLADIFKEVQIVDPRYIENIDMTYEDIITNINSDIIMFMYNSFGFEGMIKEMINKKID
ncbi:hypothetical protein [Clostridium sp. CCUG 7971]|uniref:hypothetical protein n=1 Tax=Clostridium sp. CCUG 7971 TaxID=2811414 RepID=UPI001ABB28F1|nr:hypothetical protein [Clostridium sp. CCUG 7971]MBO3444891.1 hypothetical protein [Clostridium sp. CCUG 7971]